MKTEYRGALVGALALSAALITPAHAGEIKIGIVGPMSGQFASEGQDMENAIKLAFSQVNAKGGAAGNTIVTVTGDDACDPQQASPRPSKLVSAGVSAVVGGCCSGASLPALKIYGEPGFPISSSLRTRTSSSPKIAATRS